MTFQFKCDSTNGFQEINGSASFNENFLNFEYQPIHLGLVKGEVKNVSIPFDQINEINFIEKFFSKKIQVALTSLKNLDKFPILDNYIIEIPVKRKDKDRAYEFVVKINYNLGQYRLSKME